VINVGYAIFYENRLTTVYTYHCGKVKTRLGRRIDDVLLIV